MDKICVITGPTSGIGRETALALAGQGFHLGLVCRNQVKGEDLVKEINKKFPDAKVDLFIADISLMSSVRHLADEIKKRYDRIDILINNAGGIFLRYKETAEGLETTFATNYFGHFLLTHLLRDLLTNSKAARIINVSSSAHYRGHLNFDDLTMKKNYAFFQAYSNSKLAQVLIMREYLQKFKGTKITINALHPGVVATNFTNNLVGPFVIIGNIYKRFFTIPSKEGAQTSIYLASSPEVEGITGLFFDECKPRVAAPEALDEIEAKKLWEISMEVTDLKHNDIG